jgi:hypothetical protein
MPTTTSLFAFAAPGTPRSGFVQHRSFRTTLDENKGSLKTTLDENERMKPHYLRPITSALDHINANNYSGIHRQPE